MNNLVKFIEKAIKEDSRYDNVDTGEGSNFYDLVVLPMALVLEEKIGTGIIDEELEKLSPSNYKNMTEEELRQTAEKLYIDLPQKNATTGNIKLHMANPVEIEIPVGTNVHSGEKTFKTRYAVSLNAADYEKSDGLYVSPDIEVTNEHGESLSVNELRSIDVSSSDIVKISHLAMDSGVQIKSTEELYSIIKSATSSRQLISKRGIRRTLKEFSSGIKRIEIVGAGDSLMTRDVLYNVAAPNDNIKKYSDFKGRIRGTTNANNINTAFIGFYNSRPSIIVSLPSSLEITQQQYVILEDEDNSYFQIETQDILNEFFEQSSEVGGIVSDITADADSSSKTVTVADTSGIEVGNILKIVRYDAEAELLAPIIAVVESVNSITDELTIFNKLGKSISESNGDYVEVLISNGYNLGNGWIRGENGLALGKTLTQKEIMVIDERLVLGMPAYDVGSTPLLDIMSMVGIQDFLNGISEGIDIEVADDLSTISAGNTSATATTT